MQVFYATQFVLPLPAGHRFPMGKYQLLRAQLALGLGVSFVVGLLVIAAFLRYLRRFGLWAFGCYRIVLGLLLLWALAPG